MALSSPGIAIKESDFSAIVTQASSSTGAYVGNIGYGPIGEVTVVTSESQFVNTFDKPNSDTADDFMSLSSFLAYTDDLRFVRVANRETFNAVSIEDDDSSAAPTMSLDVTVEDGKITSITVPSSVQWNKDLDEENTFVVIEAEEGYTGSKAKATPNFENGVLTSVDILSKGSNYVQDHVNVTLKTGIQIKNAFDYESKYLHQNALKSEEVDTLVVAGEDKVKAKINTPRYGVFAAQYAGLKGNGLKVITFDSTDESTFEEWQYASYFSGVPGTSDYVLNRGGSNDEFHIVIVDGEGVFTGTKGEVLATYGFVSKAKDANNGSGESIWWRKALANDSYIYALCPPDYNEVYVDENNESKNTLYTATTNWDQEAQGVTFGRTRDAIEEYELTGGTFAPCSDADYMDAWDLLKDPEEVDVSIFFAGPCSDTVLNYLMSSIITPVGSTTGRSGTSILCFSAPKKLCLYNNGREAEQIKKWVSGLPHSNYYVCDCNWKYMYDRYNEVYRWTPCCSDIAGLCAYTDSVADAWWSPAGLNRGRIKNAIKLAWNPKRPERDILYQQGVNAVVSMTGEGIVLWGDKTFTNKASAFDRINVRRLFIVLEKSIAAASRALLFEFNDDITRAQFRAMVTPFLDNVKGRRGITDYRVVCDETNNTAYVIDSNQFVGDIYIRPNYSISYIYLNFACVGNSVSFEEAIGS